MHAAQRGDQLRAGVAGTQADWAGGGGARWRLRVSALDSGGHDEGVRVVGVALHQQVHVPLTVNQQVLSPVQVQTQSPRNLKSPRSDQLREHTRVHRCQKTRETAELHEIKLTCWTVLCIS